MQVQLDPQRLQLMPGRISLIVQQKKPSWPAIAISSSVLPPCQAGREAGRTKLKDIGPLSRSPRWPNLARATA
jgi:hypothetical protein